MLLKSKREKPLEKEKYRKGKRVREKETDRQIDRERRGKECAMEKREDK